jgi:hypothetical protein
MQYVTVGSLTVSRFILGGNPFSGFSHQGQNRDREMLHYFTATRIKQTLREAESLGINTLLARVDQHIVRILMEYWDEGGTIQWIAQTCPELGAPLASAERAIAFGAKACYIHGGMMDFLLAQKRLAEVPPVLEKIRAAGLPAGVAGHNPKVFAWAEANLQADFYMCSYYNAAHRDQRAEHVSGMPEWFRDDDRQAMSATIRTLARPVIHYKILAAGRNDPAAAFRHAASTMRPTDMVGVGIYPKDRPGMLREDVALFETALKEAGQDAG